MSTPSTSGRPHVPTHRASGHRGWRRPQCRSVIVRATGSNTAREAKVISTLEFQDLPTHLQISQLITDVFFDDPEQNTSVKRPGPFDRVSHRVSNLLWSLTLHAARPYNHYTLYLSDPSEPSQGGQAQVVASVVLSFERLQGQVLDALGAREPLAVGWVSSLAVHPLHRGRGLATTLMEACEQLATGALPGGGYMCLHVYRDNPRAQRLYQRLGYSEALWLDPRWLQAAEKGQMGPPQRILMFKALGSLPEQLLSVQPTSPVADAQQEACQHG